MRKLLSVILALVMVLGVFTPVFAEEAAPKAEEKPAEATETAEAPAAAALEKHIEFLKEQGIIEGDKSGNLMLEQNIDRASFAAILVRAAGKDATAKSVQALPGRFKDMNPSHWANGYATVAHDNNLMKGNPAGEFMPGKQISYAEIATTLVRFLGKEKAGFVYPTSYIAAATELGLFADVEIGGAYTENATRNNVFHMLYNAVSKEDFGKYNVYKAIVLENGRVAQLKADEIKVEVLSVVQIANNVDARGTAKVGEQFVLNVKDVKVENGLADSENLLGKVADITLDENNKLVKVVVDDKNYEYYYGRFTASKDGKTFKTNGKTFNVRFDERYYDEYVRSDYRVYSRTSERDDRVYRTYVTSGSRAENFNYIRFAERYSLPNDHADKINANFARVTVKDGMVLFVDAYDLKDIAPVKEVAREGKEVNYWNDDRDAAVERMTPERRVVGYTAKEGFKNIEAKDIKVDDTIHWMKGFTLVRQDAKVDAKLVKTYRNYAGEWVVLKVADDKEIVKNLNSEISIVKPYRSVYAYDDQHYRRTKNRGDVDAMVGSDVKVLLDIREGVQLITSHEKFADQLGLLNKVSSANGTEFFKANAPEENIFRLKDGWDSNYYKKGKWNATVGRSNKLTQENKWAELNRLDLAYTTSDKDGNAGIVAVIDGFEYNGDYYLNPYQDATEPTTSTWRTARFINARRNFLKVGTKDYRYTDDTEVFVVNKEKDRFDNTARQHVIEKVTLEDVKKYNENNLSLEAVVLTEANYAKFLKKIKVNSYGRYDSTRDDFAKAIIFTNYKGPQAKLAETEIGRVSRVDRWAEVAEVELEPGKFEEFKIKGGDLDMTTSVVDKFVFFRRVKDSEPVAARFDGLVPLETVGTIAKFDHHILVNGFQKYNVDKVTKEFGDSRTGYGKVYVNGGYADLIVYEEKGSSTPSASPVDELLANAFVTKVNNLKNTSTDEDFLTAVDMYNKLSDAAKGLEKVEKARKNLDRLFQIKLGRDYSVEYANVLARVVNITSKTDVEAKAIIKADLKAAEELKTEFDKYAATGMNLGTGVTFNKGVQTKFNRLINDVKIDANTDAVKKLTTDYNNHVATVKADVANKFRILGEDVPTAKQTEAEYIQAKTAADSVATFSKIVTKTKEADVKEEIAGLKAELQKLVNTYNSADALARTNILGR